MIVLETVIPGIRVFKLENDINNFKFYKKKINNKQQFYAYLFFNLIKNFVINL